MEAITIGNSRGYLIVAALGSLGLVAGGIFIWLMKGPALVGWMNIVFFGACFLLIGK